MNLYKAIDKINISSFFFLLFTMADMRFLANQKRDNCKRTDPCLMDWTFCHLQKLSMLPQRYKGSEHTERFQPMGRSSFRHGDM